MSRQERKTQQGIPPASGADPREERLRVICAAMYEPVSPSEALRRRVAEAAAREEAPVKRRGVWGALSSNGWGMGVAAGSTVFLLVALGLMLVRTEHRRSTGRKSPAVAELPRPERPAERSFPGSAPKERESWISARPLVPAPTPGERHRHHLLLVSDGARIGAGRHGSRARGVPAPAAVFGDLASLNGDPGEAVRQWAPRSPDEWAAIEARVRGHVRMRDDFVTIPFPRIAAADARQIAAAAESYQREAAIIDARLAREVTCAFKGTALSDLCDQLRIETGIQLTAGPSVADEKVTVFCEKQPLREVMRQLSRPFGYTWLRSGKAGEYRYELAQDLRSQLLEEELRNRDRNEAQIALDREMQRYREFLRLSPDEALARAKTAPPEEKKLLERLGGKGWGPIQIYFRLSPSDLAALRSAQTLHFRQDPEPGEQPLSADLASGVLACLRDVRLVRTEKGFDFARPRDRESALPLTSVPEARAGVNLTLRQTEPGRFSLEGSSRVSTGKNIAEGGFSDGPVAIGMSPSPLEPTDAAREKELARDPALRSRVSVQARPSCGVDPTPGPSAGRRVVTNGPPGEQSPAAGLSPPSPSEGPGTREAGGGGGIPLEPTATSADVLEAVHRATGLPLVADYYTRLYKTERLSVQNRLLFEILNQLCEAMRYRWNKQGDWLQFRSASFFNDRLKEVPNRLLSRWTASRKEHGSLTLDDLIEISQLSDAQLDAEEMAEGARDCHGLVEWKLACDRSLRPDWRFLAQLTPAQRREAQSIAGLAFVKLSLGQQQRFIDVAIGDYGVELRSLRELETASLRVAYTQPGEFEWRVPGPPAWLGWQPSPARAKTREAALQAARRLDPQATDAQIVPTEVAISVLYACEPRPYAYVNAVQATLHGKGAGRYNGYPRPPREAAGPASPP